MIYKHLWNLKCELYKTILQVKYILPYFMYLYLILINWTKQEKGQISYPISERG